MCYTVSSNMNTFMHEKAQFAITLKRITMYLASTLADIKIFISEWIVFIVFQWFAVWQQHTRSYVQSQVAQMLCMLTLKLCFIQCLHSPKTIKAFRLLAQLVEGNQFCSFWNSLRFLDILHYPESYQVVYFWLSRKVSFSKLQIKHGSQLPLNSLESEVRNFIGVPRPLLQLRSILLLISTKQTIVGSIFGFQKWMHHSWPWAFPQKQTAISAGHQK